MVAHAICLQGQSHDEVSVEDVDVVDVAELIDLPRVEPAGVVGVELGLGDGSD
jgi:hypothetical protein